MSVKVETIRDTTTFEALGHEWSVPTKRHLSHILKLEERVEQGRALTATFIVRVFLEDDQWDRLCEFDPDEAQLEELAAKVAEALGMGDSGNSEPSSASS